MAERKKKQKIEDMPAPAYMTTYGDMVTLLLTFFVLMYSAETAKGEDVQVILSAFKGMGMMSGGNTLEEGKLAELGNTVDSLPSLEKGRSLSDARKRAVSEFQTDTEIKKMKVKADERGLVITIAGDLLFEEGSAEVKIEETRDVLQRAAQIIREYADGRKVRIEGHTDSGAPPIDSPYKNNWELSAARAINVLRYLVDYNVDESCFQVAGFADTVPIEDNDLPEGQAYNRRVDIVILSDGHLNTKYDF